MTKNEIFPSRWLKSVDLPQDGENVTIREVSVQEVGEEREQKPVMTFDEFDKELVLNVTNWGSIVDLTGFVDSDDWPGCRIKLVRVRVAFGGKNVEAIRVESADQVKPVRRSLPKRHAVAATPAQNEQDGEFSDPY